MNRITLINKLIKEKNPVNYLEIGVKYGLTFLKITAHRKWGVDPSWPGFKVWLHVLKNPKAGFFWMKSDKFFKKHSSILSDNPPDIVFVDGLHEYHQSLKDIQNCLKYLPDDGIIVMHDCNPQSESAAIPISQRPPDREPGPWNGDVYKTIVYLRCHYDDLNVFVLDCDFGLGVITRGKPESMLNLDDQTIEQMQYSDLENDRANILNLKSPDYVDTFPGQIKTH